MTTPAVTTGSTPPLLASAMNMTPTVPAMPKEVHERLMKDLRRVLTEEQIEQILDKYTVGKVAFTLKGYQAIVPNMTEEETAYVLEQLKLAREQAIDYKNMKQISAIFEIYKTKCEQYFRRPRCAVLPVLAVVLAALSALAVLRAVFSTAGASAAVETTFFFSDMDSTFFLKNICAVHSAG